MPNAPGARGRGLPRRASRALAQHRPRRALRDRAGDRIASQSRVQAAVRAFPRTATLATAFGLAACAEGSRSAPTAARILALAVAALALTAPAAVAVPDCSPMPAARTLASGQGVLESIAADARGRLFISDLGAGRILLGRRAQGHPACAHERDRRAGWPGHRRRRQARRRLRRQRGRGTGRRRPGRSGAHRHRHRRTAPDHPRARHGQRRRARPGRHLLRLQRLRRRRRPHPAQRRGGRLGQAGVLQRAGGRHREPLPGTSTRPSPTPRSSASTWPSPVG